MKKYHINQGTEEWFNLKLGKITGTVLADLMGTPKAKENCLIELVAERLTPGVDMEHIYENPMSRGIRCEPLAVKAFEYVTGKKIEHVGLCENDDNKWIGYSSDGIVVGTDDTEDIEIKSCEGRNHMKIVLSNEVPKEYHWQIVQGFVVNPKLKKRWFIAFNPDIVSYPIHIIEVKRESLEQEVQEAYQIQIEFLKEVQQKLSTIN